MPEGWLRSSSCADGSCVEMAWVKSSFSYEVQCVEMAWVKSTACNSPDHGCVELAAEPDGVAMRDSKDPDGPVLHFTQAEIAAYFKGVRAGEFDHFIE